MKNSPLDTTVSFYESVTRTKPVDANLYDLLIGGAYKSQVLPMRRECDPKKQTALKQALPCFTPSGIFSGSRDATLLQHTGLICVDIDAKDNTGVEGFDQFKQSIAALPFVAYCGLSARGCGYFCIIPIARPERHKQHARALAADFADCGIVIDTSCENVGRKRFVSYDPDPYINLKAETYTHTLEPQRKRPKQAKKGRGGRSSSGRDTAVEVARAISTLCLEERDITEGYAAWFEIGAALANEFGEDGRIMFHAISRWDPDYNGDECDAKFDECLTVHGYNIGTFFHYYNGTAPDPVAEVRRVFAEYIKQ